MENPITAFIPNRSLDIGEIARLCHAACFWPSRRRSGLRRGVGRNRMRTETGKMPGSLISPIGNGFGVSNDRFGFIASMPTDNSGIAWQGYVCVFLAILSEIPTRFPVPAAVSRGFCLISLLYRNRWSVELFFKWIRHRLGIQKFRGASENAVRIQVYCAMATLTA